MERMRKRGGAVAESHTLHLLSSLATSITGVSLISDQSNLTSGSASIFRSAGLTEQDLIAYAGTEDFLVR